MQQIATRHGATPAQVALAWLLRQDGVIAIPKATQPAHVALNAAAADLQLAPEDCQALDQVFKAPQRKQRLEMV
jgi:diketogulonate reductase-like aldo/keto reductase